VTKFFEKKPDKKMTKVKNDRVSPRTDSSAEQTCA